MCHGTQVSQRLFFFPRAHMLERDLLQGTSDEIFQVK